VITRAIKTARLVPMSKFCLHNTLHTLHITEIQSDGYKHKTKLLRLKAFLIYVINVAGINSTAN